MNTKNQLLKEISEIGIKPDDTLMIHSSMKSIGEVDGGAETVLDAFMEYIKPGLLVFPTHTWNIMGEDHPVFYPQTDLSCVGILSNLFFQRPGVKRSLHPFESVAAIGKGAEDFIAGEEYSRTPCSRQGCYGKLYDRNAKILFLGCSMSKNTFLHGVEEWNHIPNRLAAELSPFQVATPDGRLLECSVHRCESPVGDISVHYGKMKEPYLKTGIAVKGKIGDADSILCDAVSMADLTSYLLSKNPDLFLDDSPVPETWADEWLKNGKPKLR
jgi:aminoglycoside 3-N-acetyltransferase